MTQQTSYRPVNHSKFQHKELSCYKFVNNQWLIGSNTTQMQQVDSYCVDWFFYVCILSHFSYCTQLLFVILMKYLIFYSY